MYKHARILAAAVLCLVSVTSAAEAAAVRFGATVAVIAAVARGNVVAYDSTNKVYLVVSSHGVVWGRFVDGSGNPIGGAFQIQGNPANFGHFPRAAFSPDADGGAGGFLVTWHEGGPSVHGRMVSYGKGGPFGADTQLTADVSWWEAGAPIAYSTISKEFLVAWRSIPVRGGAPFNDIHAVRVDNNAAPKGPVFAITNDVHYQDNPSIAYNSVSDEFLVVYAGYNDAGGFAFADAQRVQPTTGALIGGATRLVVTGGVYITDVTFNAATQKYLASWYSLPAGAALGRNLNGDGSLSGDIIMLSNRWKAYDALSVAYNPVSSTFFMVSHGTTAEDGGVEIASGGTPVDNGFQVTAAGGKGNFYPRIAASTGEPNWLVSASNDFARTVTQLIAGSASGNPPTAPTPPAPPAAAPTSSPLMNIDAPGNGTTVSSRGFQVAGWAIDRGSSSGPGIDAIHVYAWPVSGAAPIFIGAANYGIARPDVGNAFGAANFTASGFSILATGIPVGTYDLAVYAHSRLSDKFDQRVYRINVLAPPSNPRMYIDLPAQNSTQTQNNVVIAGWALDLATAGGSGVDAIHIYAYRAGSNTPIWLGAAAYGGARPDVAGVFGSSQFTSCAFSLTTSLPPDNYTIVVFAHSNVTGTFNNAQTVAVSVR